MDPAGIAIASAAIGAGGAIATQIIAAIFTHVQSKADIKQRSDQFNEQVSLEKSTRIYNARQDAYFAFMRSLDACIESIQAIFRGEQENEALPTIPGDFSELFKEVQGNWSDVRLVGSVDVIRVGDLAFASTAATALSVSRVDLFSRKKVDENIQSTVRHRHLLVECMRADLRGEKWDREREASRVTKTTDSPFHDRLDRLRDIPGDWNPTPRR